MPKKPKKKGSTIPGHPTQTIAIGGFKLITFHDGSAWILNEIGEGMQTDTATLSKAIATFWKRNF